MVYRHVSIKGIWKLSVELKENQHSFPGVGIRSYSSDESSNSSKSPDAVRQTESRSRFIYPDFLPAPAMEFRHPIKEKIERQDMLKRR